MEFALDDDQEALVELARSILADHCGDDQLRAFAASGAPFDARLWQLLSQAHETLGQRAEAHRAAAEQYLLQGSSMAALDQLRRAQRAGDTDFYTASVIDARIRDVEDDARRELEETRQQGGPR